MLLVGQQLGPFVVEKELGAGAMGTVYQATYTKNDMKVAIKVMLPGMATNEQAMRRFKREAAILKQFNHPNIVKIFAIGKHAGMRYYAMELVQGESLDRVLARRERLSWEEVVELGQQLCAALQHSHAKGVIHRDLKPSNLMILRDGTLKLTDFGIAKDLDVTQLTSANCTVGTAAYMSPEQCRGERDITYKSDLYSLGIVFYELITGKKPFEAENVMDMFMAHVQGTFVRPDRLVTEMPAELSTLICQLLEKKPEHRPLDAEKIKTRLAEIMTNYELKKSAGLEMVEKRRVDHDRGTSSAQNEEDREAAKSLIDGKRRRRRKKPKKIPFYRQGWFIIVGVIGMFAAMGFIFYLLFLKPPDAEGLYLKAEKIMQQRDPEIWYRARSDRGVFDEYFHHYGTEGDDDATRQQKMRQWASEVDIYLKEILLDKMIRQHRKGFKVGIQSELEQIAFDAAKEEDQGRMSEAIAKWQTLREEYARTQIGRGWDLLANHRIQMLNNLPSVEAGEVAKIQSAHSLRSEPKLQSGAEERAFTAIRLERFGDKHEARDHWESLKKELAEKPEDRLWYLLASKKLEQIKSSLPKLEEGMTEKQFRHALVSSQLKRAEMLQSTNVLAAMGICMDIMALYRGEPELSSQVEQAEKLFKKLNGS